MFHTLRPETKKDANQWKFISIVCNDGTTVDLKFDKFDESRDFFIAVSEATSFCNRRFTGVTEKGMVTMMLMRSKIQKMAKLRKTTVPGLFSIGIF